MPIEGGWPGSIAELVEFLKVNPRVRSRCDDPRIPDEDLTFRGVKDGGLWWDKAGGGEGYTPIDCGMTAAESGVEFRFMGFDLTKFGITIRFDYIVIAHLAGREMWN